MRIGFDVSPLVRPHPPGLVRAVGGALAELERRARIEVVRLAPAPGRQLRAWRRRELVQQARANGCAGVHSFVSAFPLRAGLPRVQTVHELPWKHGVRENSDYRHRTWAALGALAAARVCVPSEGVARDLRGHVLRGAHKVRVVPWGVGAPFTAEPEGETFDELVLARLKLSLDAFALCPGAVRPKKNLAAVIAGLCELDARGGPRLRLVVTGADSHALIKNLARAEQLGLAGRISTPGAVSDADLASLYRQAAVVPVLSISEGFAFPVLEALACGASVVVPRGSVQAELAGPQAIHVDPLDPRAVAAGLARAVAERWRLRDERVARARQFGWERTAERIESLWREIAV